MRTHGPGRTLPADGTVNQVPTIVDDTVSATNVAFKDNGARTVTAVKTAAYTASFGDFVRVDTTAAGVSITLPTIVSGENDHAPIIVKRTAGSNNVTVIGTVDGGTNTTVSTVSKTFYSNGTSWTTL
jgi:hypothetical protein